MPGWVTVISLTIVGVFAFLATADVIVLFGPPQPEAVYWLMILGTIITGGYIGLLLNHFMLTRKVEERLVYPMVIAVVVVVLMASCAAFVRLGDAEPLREFDGAITYEIRDLPGGFYKSWDYASVWIYSGEPTLEGNYIIYPITGVWPLNSTALTGTVDGVDFGARELGDCWFNLEVTDINGNARVDDGDQLKVYSQNGSFPEDEVYYLEFVVRSQLNSGIAPYNVVLGLEFSFWGFDSWVEYGPVEYAW